MQIHPLIELALDVMAMQLKLWTWRTGVEDPFGKFASQCAVLFTSAFHTLFGVFAHYPAFILSHMASGYQVVSNTCAIAGIDKPTSKYY